MKRLTRSEAKQIHDHSACHREEIEHSSRCWCISCEKEFSPSEINDWTDNEETALCPYCYVDAIVGDASGYILTQSQIHQLNKIYF